jgi:phosphonate transport system substrate-binding protein
MRTLFAAFAAWLALSLPYPAAAQTKPILYFSAIPDEDESKLVQRFSRVAEYLSKQLDVQVRYIPVKSYPAAVTAFRNDQIQLAWFGGLSGVQARKLVPGSQALAQGEEDKAFVAYFIAHESTGLQPTNGIPPAAKGMTFTFGAKTSTSGRLMPEFFMRQNTNMAPEAFFSRVGYSGDHTQTLKLVSTGAYQMGALNFASYEDAVAQNLPETKTVRLIWKSPPFPDYNWTIRGDVDGKYGAGFTQKVKAALIGMKDESLLKAFPRKSFIAATNDDYAPIEKVGRELKLLE